MAVARWSPDSKFCVLTTISAGGHSPWQFEPYVFSVASRRFRFLGDGSFEAVINPDFRFAAPATVLFTTRQGTTPLPLGASVDPAQAHWRALLSRVHVGMSRARVEQLLGHAEAGEAEGHTALYLLDAHWCAAIPFDWHGYDPDERRNPDGLLHLYAHCVTARPRLLARTTALDAQLQQALHTAQSPGTAATP